VFSPILVTGERGGVAFGRLTTKDEGGGEKSVPVPERWTLKLDGGGTEARGISSYTPFEGDDGPRRLTLNDFGASVSISRLGVEVVGATAGVDGPDRLDTLNDLPSVLGGGRPANIAPLSAASAAFRALFSSLTISATSSKLSFLFNPNIPLQPGVDFFGV
jgi:hypothetical protein